MTGMNGLLAHNYVVAFLGRRDYYQAAVAFAETGHLEALVTDLYCPTALRPFVERVPTSLARKLAGRQAAGLPSSLVQTPLLETEVKPRLQRLLGRSAESVDEECGFALGAAAAKQAVRSESAALVYSYYWLGFASQRWPHQAPRILLQVHPLPHQVRRILAGDKRRVGVTRATDFEEWMSPAAIDAYQSSLDRADGVIATSSFVRQGFLELGYPSDQIFVVPYGSELSVRPGSSHPAVRRPSAVSKPLRLLWVGQLAYRKGPHHLIEALRMLPPHEFSLTMLCRTQPDLDLLRDLPPSVKILSSVPDNSLSNLYDEHDVFVMPSLVEGFGMVYLEAMSRGLPIVTTENGGGPDIITDGREGFIVSVGDPSAIAAALQRYIDEPGLVARMGEQASFRAQCFTWARFRAGIREAAAATERRKSTPQSKVLVHAK